MQIIALVSEQPLNRVIKQWQGQANYRKLKETAAELVALLLKNHKTAILNVHEQDIVTILEKDEQTVRQMANVKLDKVQTAIGLRAPKRP